MEEQSSVRVFYRNLAVLAAVSFVAFFIWIVAIANRGDGALWWAFIHRIPAGDKMGHLGLIGTMSFLCNLAFPSRKLAFLTLTSLVVLLAFSLEELSQGFIATRQLDFFDWLADAAGLVLGQAGAVKFRKMLRSRATTAP